MEYSLYVHGKRKKGRKKNYVNFKFSGKSKESQNNKVLEKLRNQKKDFPVN